MINALAWHPLPLCLWKFLHVMHDKCGNKKLISLFPYCRTIWTTTDYSMLIDLSIQISVDLMAIMMNLLNQPLWSCWIAKIFHVTYYQCGYKKIIAWPNHFDCHRWLYAYRFIYPSCQDWSWLMLSWMIFSGYARSSCYPWPMWS